MRGGRLAPVAGPRPCADPIDHRLTVRYLGGPPALLELEGVREITARLGPIDVAALFASGVRESVFGEGCLTLASDPIAEATRILGIRCEEAAL